MDHDVLPAAQPLTGAVPEYPSRTIRQGIARKSRLQRPPGIRNYDITDPAKPISSSEFNTEEKGTHAP